MLEIVSSVACDFEYTLSHSQLEIYLNLGKLHFEVASYERVLERLLDLLKEEELTPAYHLDDLKVLDARITFKLV